MADKEKLNILNEAGEIAGEELRSDIHKQGLLHAEIHVWFFTPQGELIFQHRAKDKDTYPDLLDATVGGHVEIGETYEEAAIKETREETGLEVKLDDLIFLEDIKNKTYDKITGMTNYYLRKVFAYKFKGKLEDLRVENNKALGFKKWKISDLLSSNFLYKDRFIDDYFSDNYMRIYKKIKNLI